MNKIFFTADNNFGSERHLKLSKRPFTDVNEMNKVMIHKWNSVVGKDDRVFHLGNFGTPQTILQLNGKISMVMGNYELNDPEIVRFLRPYVRFLPGSSIIRLPVSTEGLIVDEDSDLIQKGDVDHFSVQLVHEPSHAMPELEAFVLFAHIHKTQMVKRNGLNVGVDCHNFTPIDLDEFLFWKNAIENHYDHEVFLPSVGQATKEGL